MSALLLGALALPLVPRVDAEQVPVAREATIPNRLIDYRAFSQAVQEAGRLRAERRVSEARFIEMAREENTLILDTRSAAKFALLHVKGAVHLNFSDITTDSLAKVIPRKDTRILIYCNNNFDGEPKAFASKKPEAALNLPTFVTLYSYGYTNIYELGPLLDVRKTNLELVGQQLARLDR